ncbi:alpha/beta hydrolase [Actinophytocola algeriensis]|uniref:Dienelactone hydrolase n=1 Tax=Actinophytocola algeriensis TaxID=1768010 RepID=A0A7W7VFV9_9PSEU|nr:hypothetical protein [Actinophytocola algeriensis]MBB4908743.1 dienelactone hydrolase [Actinophytocola algeriensis]MBE1474870.1 dienelactone hydrolase [Actinophytocola algeriensis]
MRRSGVLLAALVMVAGSIHAGPAGATSDGADHRRVSTVEYDLGDTAFTDPETGTVSEIRAVVHHPVRWRGQLPLIVAQHGSWYACTAPDAQEWPCDKGEPFPGYRGYDYLGSALAERGFVVVSISVDGINMTSFDYGDRARLLNEHLRLWGELARGAGSLARRLPGLVGRVDMARVGTMGHSRGGKGVMWQASDKHRSAWPAGVRVRAVLPLAPVKFDWPEGDNSDTLVTRVPVAVVTSGCDGAVHERGQEYLDDAEGTTREPAYSVSLTHGNHNFFNTRWTPPSPLGEDDSTCPREQISPRRQQNALVTYATAFYERHLKGNAAFDAVLTGDRPLPHVDSATRVVVPVG